MLVVETNWCLYFIPLEVQHCPSNKPEDSRKVHCSIPKACLAAAPKRHHLLMPLVHAIWLPTFSNLSITTSVDCIQRQQNNLTCSHFLLLLVPHQHIQLEQRFLCRGLMCHQRRTCLSYMALKALISLDHNHMPVLYLKWIVDSFMMGCLLSQELDSAAIREHPQAQLVAFSDWNHQCMSSATRTALLLACTCPAGWCHISPAAWPCQGHLCFQRKLLTDSLFWYFHWPDQLCAT